MRKKLARAEKLYPSQNGIEVSYINVADVEDQVSLLKEKADGGFDDIFVMIPVAPVVTDAADMLNRMAPELLRGTAGQRVFGAGEFLRCALFLYALCGNVWR